MSQASTTAGLTSEDYNCQFGVLVEQIMRFRLREIRKLIGETSAKKKLFETLALSDLTAAPAL